jgi:hypothetical protein
MGIYQRCPVRVAPIQIQGVVRVMHQGAPLVHRIYQGVRSNFVRAILCESSFVRCAIASSHGCPWQHTNLRQGFLSN